ncbi:hypothetical protein GCM10011361_25150 [Muriicola marianensis]|uniref:Lipocalin-like domain-containing protein n=2 Tax=Muriicola marianensis TaxID=1324801 RepID=A0ABQ1R6L2_9FLAO|nr:hypothetical protein GCM10011361_25150 [Muriicola marianensis]
MMVSCRQEITKEDLGYLDGYWEIEEVVFPSGDSKKYDISTTVDYIETSGMSGYRKKVQPLPDGSFITSDDAEQFTISVRDGNYFMEYRNEMSEWEEKIESLTPTNFSVINTDQIRYLYKRFEPINLDTDGS